jgi:hypothetical protein
MLLSKGATWLSVSYNGIYVEKPDSSWRHEWWIGVYSKNGVTLEAEIERYDIAELLLAILDADDINNLFTDGKFRRPS